MTYKQIIDAQAGLGIILNKDITGLDISPGVRKKASRLSKEIKKIFTVYNDLLDDIEVGFEIYLIKNPLPYNCPKCGHQTSRKYPDIAQKDFEKYVKELKKGEIPETKFPEFTFEDLIKYNLTANEEGDLLSLSILVDNS